VNTKKRLVDLSGYYGRLELSGNDCIDLLDRLSTNDISSLHDPGQGRLSVLTTNKGRIIDLLGIFLFEDKVLLISSSDSVSRVTEWIEFYTIMEDAQVTNVSEVSFHLRSIDNVELQKEFGITELAVGETLSVNIAGKLCSIIKLKMGSTTVVDIIGNIADKKAVLLKLRYGIKMIDNGEFESLRINFGVPAYGKELSEDYNPIEAGLIDHISFNKGCYIGQEVVARLNAYDKVQRKLVKLGWSDNSIDSCELVADGKIIGKITSMGYGEGLGYVRRAYAISGQVVQCNGSDVIVEVIT